MTGFVKAIMKDELEDGRRKIVRLNGRNIALFRVNGAYYAVANNCLHRGGPLGEGEVDNYQVTCPWHGWKYDVRDGSFTVIPTLKVKTYPVKVEDGMVLVDVP
ncbi:MAG TPA: Rieske (2Fe-2S) protein [Candidatus Bathyarchaeia archaeon]|nr:Rieske (2Fe-2S) protein [Candidatus Bathyarchaeia archaeon]